MELPNVYSFCDQLTPIQSCQLFKSCSLAITNDTEPMHLAYTTNIPLIALFSSRDFSKRWFPPAANQNVVFRTENIACSLCLSDNCKDNKCMKMIQLWQVIEAGEKLLNQFSQNENPVQQVLHD